MSHEAHKTMGRESEALSALSRILDHVHQMEDLFPDDEQLQEAIAEAEEVVYGSTNRRERKE